MLFSCLLISFFSSIDSLCCGISYGIRKIKIPYTSLIVISLAQLFLMLPLMFFSSFFCNIINEQIVKVLIATIFILLGVSTLINSLREKKAIINNFEMADLDKNKIISWTEAIILGITMAIDNSILGISLSLSGYSISLTIACFFIMHTILLFLGTRIYKIKCIQKVSTKLTLIPSIIFFLLGLFQIIQ